MSQRTLLLLSQDNAHYERLLKAANLPHLRILQANNQLDAEKNGSHVFRKSQKLLMLQEK